MPGGSVGSIYAEAELDISKFQASAAQIDGLGAGIASAMDLAAAGFSRAQAQMNGLGAGMAAGLANTGQVIAAANQLSAGVLKALGSGVSGASGIGRRFSAGLASGIASGRSGVISAAAAVARAAAQAARAALQIHSPSRVTQSFGENFDRGFVKGVQGELPAIDRAVRRAVYVKPPVSAGMRGSVEAPRVTAQPAFDYEALAEASAARSVVMHLDGRTVAEVNARNTALAQNRRARDIAVRYGGR